MTFAHLAAKTCYSLRDGAIKPRALAEAVAEHGMDAIGVADRDGLYGAVRFADACARTNIRPIFASDLTLSPDATRPGWAVTRPGPTKTIRALATAATAPGSPAEGDDPSAVGWGARQEWAKRPFPPRRSGSWTPSGPGSGPAWLEDDAPRTILIARTQTGYANLCRTVTEAHLGSERSDPHLSWDGLERWAGRSDSGLYVLLGDDSPVGRLLEAGRHDAATDEVRRWMDLVGPEHVLIGITQHLAPGDDARARDRFALADRLGLRAVAHQAPRYLDPSGARIADVMEAIRLQVPVDPRHSSRRNAEGWLKDPAAMAQVFAERPDALRHAAEIADSCRVDLGLGRLRVPDFVGLGEGAQATLAARCRSGLGERYPKLTARHHDLLERELAMTAELGLPSYFLTVADIVDRIREKGIMAACRGSAAGSIIAYALRISDVDPIAHDLVFERFMNPYRDDLPDIDIDVESARREDIYRDLLDRYGSDRVACVCMVETFKARMAIREVGKALGLPAGEVDYIAKSFPHVRAGDVRPALEHLPEMRGLNLDKGQVGLLFDLVERMDGFPRHIALHPSGVLLADTWLRDCVPLERSAAGFAMAQFDKDDVEALGMCKLDLLAVRMLSSMAHCASEVRRTRGVDLDFATVPWNDEPTYELIRSTRTLGMFQIESPGQRELIGKFQPEHVGDLVVDISLFRPGPVKGDMVGPFLQRRLGQAKTVRPLFPNGQPVTEPAEKKGAIFPHPLLEPALEETFGVIVYHEQVMRVVAALTGCDLASADLVRRRLGDPDELPDLERWIVGSAVERGMPEAVARSVWKALAQFASFGFCKAHAAAFAVPTYRSAWLKRHYLPEFVAGLLTHDPGMYPRRLLLDDARQFAVCVLPLDVNVSAREYRVERVPAGRALELLGIEQEYRRIEPLASDTTPRVQSRLPRGWRQTEDGNLVPPAGMDLGVDPEHPGWRFGIRLGLQDVVGIDDRQIESLLVGRPFTSVGDVRRRASLSAPVAEGLAHAGALDDLGGVQAGACTRRDLLLEVTERWSGLRRHGWVGGDQDPAQPEQLDLLGDPEPPGLAEYRPSDRVRAELEVLGMEASRHVITFYDDLLDLLEVTRTVDLLDRRNGERVRVAGVKVATQTPPVKSGQRIIFLSVDDATGVSDATFFESVHERCAWTVFHTWLLVVEGTVHRTGARGIGINADAVWDLRRLMRAWREGWLNEAMAEAGRPHAEAARDFSDQAPGGTQGVPGRSGLGPDPQGDQAVTGLPARDDRPYSGRGPASGALASDHHHPLYDALHLDEARRRRADEEPGRPSRMGPNGATWADPAQRHPGVDPIDVVRLPSGHPAHPGRVPADQEGRPAPPRRRPAAEEEGDPPRKLWHASGGSAGH